MSMIRVIPYQSRSTSHIKIWCDAPSIVKKIDSIIRCTPRFKKGACGHLPKTYMDTFILFRFRYEKFLTCVELVLTKKYRGTCIKYFTFEEFTITIHTSCVRLVHLYESYESLLPNFSLTVASPTCINTYVM